MKYIVTILTFLISTIAVAQITNVTFKCRNCNGLRTWKRTTTKECTNCNYWTNTQKEYNYCNLCRNQRIIVTKEWIETCKTCNGRGIETISVPSIFTPIFNSNIIKNENSNHWRFQEYHKDVKDRSLDGLTFDYGSESSHGIVYLTVDGHAVYADGYTLYSKGDEMYVGKWSIIDNNNIKIIIEKYKHEDWLYVSNTTDNWLGNFHIVSK